MLLNYQYYRIIILSVYFSHILEFLIYYNVILTRYRTLHIKIAYRYINMLGCINYKAVHVYINCILLCSVIDTVNNVQSCYHE